MGASETRESAKLGATLLIPQPFQPRHAEPQTDSAIDHCQPDESADHYIRGQILELFFEILWFKDSSYTQDLTNVYLLVKRYTLQMIRTLVVVQGGEYFIIFIPISGTA